MLSFHEKKVKIGVLALQGAFEEHQSCLEASDKHCTTVQVRTVAELEGLDGIVFPGGESTAMGLIGTSNGMWDALKEKVIGSKLPTWGTCAGMILLAERCVGASAVIQDGQSLIGGLNVLVCRNYFGSQISSFEMETPPPPSLSSNNEAAEESAPFPGVFIRAPAILSVDQNDDIEILGKVVATPCRQAAVVLRELERKIEAGENVVQMGVVDALDRKSHPHQIGYIDVKKEPATTINSTASENVSANRAEEEKKDVTILEEEQQEQKQNTSNIQLPGASDSTNAREVICAVRKQNILCTAFHPEITSDTRWHSYFVNMVREDSVRRSN
mmetsp:Transcript_19282/g.27897  ORF Transcript_19282/g.27897 Transcript_19282/m.27897 type:complete len:329 (+) Transcript_19282:117-1103(+)